MASLHKVSIRQFPCFVAADIPSCFLSLHWHPTIKLSQGALEDGGAVGFEQIERQDWPIEDEKKMGRRQQGNNSVEEVSEERRRTISELSSTTRGQRRLQTLLLPRHHQRHEN